MRMPMAKIMPSWRTRFCFSGATFLASMEM